MNYTYVFTILYPYIAVKKFVDILQIYDFIYSKTTNITHLFRRLKKNQKVLGKYYHISRTSDLFSCQK